MVKTFLTPKVVVSECIEFDRCRRNGDMITGHIVRRASIWALKNILKAWIVRFDESCVSTERHFLPRVRTP